MDFLLRLAGLARLVGRAAAPRKMASQVSNLLPRLTYDFQALVSRGLNFA